MAALRSYTIDEISVGLPGRSARASAASYHADFGTPLRPTEAVSAGSPNQRSRTQTAQRANCAATARRNGRRIAANSVRSMCVETAASPLTLRRGTVPHWVHEPFASGHDESASGKLPQPPGRRRWASARSNAFPCVPCCFLDAGIERQPTTRRSRRGQRTSRPCAMLIRSLSRADRWACKIFRSALSARWTALCDGQRGWAR